MILVGQLHVEEKKYTMTAPIDDTVPILDRTVPSLLRRAANLVPQQAALIEAGGRTMTYAELLDNSSRVATALRSLGLEPRDLVLVMLDQHIENVLTWFGANAASVVHVPINTSYKGEMLRYLIEQSQARVLIIEGKWCDRLAEISDDLSALRTVVIHGDPVVSVPSKFEYVSFDKLPAHEPTVLEEPVVSDVSTILYTSGTEGRAKGVMMPHGQVYQMSFSHPRTNPGREVILVTLPLFHVAGLFEGVFQAVRTQGTAVLHGVFSVSRFWDDIRRFQCTTTIVLGSMASFLLRQPPRPDDRDHTLQNVILLPSIADIDEFAKRFGVPVGAAYGSTETGPVLMAAPGSARPYLCGTPQPAYELRLVDEWDVEVPRGEVGELVIRSREPWAMNSGYHLMPTETLAAWRNLWFHTGDVFRIDDEGQFAYLDRRKDALRRRGENISSFEVEQHIVALPYIEEAAVVAVPSDAGEDEIKAVLVLTPGADFDPCDTLRHLFRLMPYFMVPRYLQVVESLPKTQTFKVRKAELRTGPYLNNVWDCEAAGFRITRNGLVESV